MSFEARVTRALEERVREVVRNCVLNEDECCTDAVPCGTQEREDLRRWVMGTPPTSSLPCSQVPYEPPAPKLGQQVRDANTDFVGTIVAISVQLRDQTLYLVQPKVRADGTIPPSQWFPASRLS